MSEPDPLLELHGRTNGATAGREIAIQTFSFALVDDGAVDAIREWAPSGIIELGAGSGYWAGRLSAAGVDVVAYDIAPVRSGANQWFTSNEWFPVRTGDETVVADHSDRCLLLVWPTKNEVWPGDAIERFHRAGGDHAVYVGEDPGGATGDDRFHVLIGTLDTCHQCAYGLLDRPCVCQIPRLFQSVRTVTIPTWSGFDDHLVLLERVEPRQRRRAIRRSRAR